MQGQQVGNSTLNSNPSTKTGPLTTKMTWRKNFSIKKSLIIINKNTNHDFTIFWWLTLYDNDMKKVHNYQHSNNFNYVYRKSPNKHPLPTTKMKCLTLFFNIFGNNLAQNNVQYLFHKKQLKYENAVKSHKAFRCPWVFIRGFTVCHHELFFKQTPYYHHNPEINIGFTDYVASKQSLTKHTDEVN